MGDFSKPFSLTLSGIMKKYKHLVTVLTSSNLDALKRLVYVIKNEVRPGELLQTEFKIIVNTLNDEYYDEVVSADLGLEVIRTESIGTAGRGKNSCHEVMLQGDYDFLTQFDGDDIFYPTFLESLSEHVRRMPILDVLGIYPCDIVNRGQKSTAGHVFDIYNDWVGSVWGISLCPFQEPRGVSKHPYLWEADRHCISQDFIILQSRKACEIMFNEEMVCAEDHLQSFKYLAEHQKGDLVYYQTMSSDMYIIDRSSPGSTQKTHKDYNYVSKLHEEVPKYVPEWRSSFSELPCFFIDLKMSHLDKEGWLQTLFKEYYEVENSS